MSKLPAVVDNNFESEVLQATLPVLVDFSATWCGPCKALEPTLESLAGEYEGRVKFVQVDIDQAHGVAARFGVTGVPTMLLFKGGEVVEKKVGALPKGNIAKMLDQALGA